MKRFHASAGTVLPVRAAPTFPGPSRSTVRRQQDAMHSPEAVHRKRKNPLASCVRIIVTASNGRDLPRSCAPAFPRFAPHKGLAGVFFYSRARGASVAAWSQAKSVPRPSRRPICTR